MTKRIFKVLAIVLAIVTGVTGIVLGVLALQGKFKTPEVYPASLSFDMESNLLIDNYADEEFSFILSAQSNSEHEVNHTTCYIQFVRGENLITLLNNDGEINQPNSSGWYQVECNNEIKFKLKDVTESNFEGDEYGIVTIVARDERNIVQSQQFSFTIDRKIDSIYLDSESTTIDNDLAVPEQVLSLGLDTRQDLTYVSSPSYALRPISSESAKTVELYYNDPNNKNDLVAITSENASQYEFLHIDDETNQMYFSSNEAGIYEFRIAVFDTFASRNEYLSDPTNEGKLNSERLNSMVSTKLTINVVNSEVTDVNVTDSGVLFNLYAGNNYLTLNGNGTDSSVNNINLGLVFSPSNSETDVRYNEVDFSLNENTSWRDNNIIFESNNGASITFSTTTSSIKGLFGEEKFFDSYTINDTADTITLTNNTTSERYNLKINYGEIEIRNRKLINSLELTINNGEAEETYTFTASNGLTFIRSDATTKSVTMLITGSYLDFYIYDANEHTYTLATDFDYEIAGVNGTGKDKNFNIIVKNQLELNSGTSLLLGALVVNSTGGELMFDTTFVTIQTVDLSYEFVDGSRNYSLDVSYRPVGDSFEAVYGEIEFGDLVTVNAGSYNAMILVTTHEYLTEIDTLENLTITDGINTYYIVGYIDDNDVFINNVRAREGATNIGAKIYMVQLKNAYDETASEIISDIYNTNVKNEIDGTVTYNPYAINVNDDIIVNTFITDNNAITININYELLEDEINFDYDLTYEYVIENPDDSISLVEGMDGYTLVISSNVPNMLTNAYGVIGADNILNHLSFYLFTGNDSYSIDNSVLSIVSATLENDQIIVNFSTLESSLNDNAYLKFVFSYKNKTIISNQIVKILDTEATDIVLNYETMVEDTPTTNTINLAQSENSALNDNMPYLNIVIAYDNMAEAYNYNAFLYDTKGNVIYNNLDVFAPQVVGINNQGFNVIPAINGVSHTLQYASTDTSIFDYDFNTKEFKTCKVGELALQISSDSNVTRYLKVVITAEQGENGFEFNVPSSQSSSKNPLKLNEFVNYSFNRTNIPTNSKFINISNINIESFGITNVTLSVENDPDNSNIYYIKADNGDTILTIADDPESWTFTRNNSYLYSSLEISFDLSVDTLSTSRRVNLSFTSSITINMNDSWSNIYANTNILLIESRESTTTNFNENALFNVTNLTGEGSVTVDINGTVLESNTYKFNTPGDYTINFSYGQGETTGIISSINISVLPNVIINVIETNVESDTTYKLSDIISVSSYDELQTYGQSGVMYSNEYLSELETIPTNLIVSANDGNSLITQTADGFKTGWITSLNSTGVNQTIDLLYTYGSGSVVLSDIELTISNKYSISGGLVGPLKTLTSYNVGLSVDGFALKSIENNKGLNIELNADKNQFTINSYLVSEQKAVFTYTFYNSSDASKELTYYTEEITISPYIPNEIDSSSILKAYTNSSYDLINNIYSDIVKDDIFINNVRSFVVLSVDNSELITNFEDIIGAGYHEGTTLVSAVANFGAISEDSATIEITYRITYKDGNYYDYTRELVVYNNTDMVINYPFIDSSLVVNGVNFKFINEEDAKNLGTTNGTIYSSSNLSFEPVSVGQTINFTNDEDLNIVRGTVLNREDGSILSADYTISLVAYQSNPTGYNYYTNIVIDGKNVTFRSSTAIASTASAYFIFKLTTETGAYEYYFVYLYNQNNTSLSGITKNTIMEQINLTSGEKILNATNNTLFGVGITNLVASLGVSSSISTQNLDFYILDAYDLAGNEKYSSLTIDGQAVETYVKIDDAVFTDPINYSVFKVAVVYANSTAVVHIGNIDFVYANNTISIGTLTATLKNNSTLSIGLTNKNGEINSGEYKADISYEVESLSAPSLTDIVLDSVNITSINNDTRFEITNDGQSVVVRDNTDVIVSLDAIIKGQINFKEQVLDDDLIFTVKYTYVKDTNTIVIFVTYTYEAIKLDFTDSTISLGDFSTVDGFNDTYKLTTIFGNYLGNITFAIDGQETEITYAGVIKEGTEGYNTDPVAITDNVSYVVIDGEPYFKFNLINKTYQTEITIKFTDVAEVKGVNSKKIIANVAMGLSISSNPYESNPYAIDVEKGSVNYTSNVGSSLTFSYSETESNYITYNLGNTNGLTIYIYINTMTKGLDFTYSDNSYVVDSIISESGSGTETTLSNENDKTINFVHSASEISDFRINVKVKYGSEYYITDSLDNTEVSIPVLVKIPQTYLGVKPIYLVKNSEYEIVDPTTNDSWGLSSLFDENNSNNIFNKYKLAIIDLNNAPTTDYNSQNIGFTNSNNPNYVTISSGSGDLTINNGNVTFGSVTTNTNASIYIINDTMGSLGAVEYKFLILPDSTRLNFTDNVRSGTVTESEKRYTYAVALINDNVIGENFSTDIEFASLIDVDNKLLYASNLAYSMDYYDSGRGTTQSSNGTYSNEDANGQEIVLNININLSVIIKINENGNLVFTINRANGTNQFKSLILEATLYGNGLICENYRFIFFNYSINSAIDNEIYASTQVNLSNAVEIKSNSDNSDLTMNNATLDTSKSYYNVPGGGTLNITSDINELFTYSTETKVIEFSPVAVDVTAHIEFMITSSIGSSSYHVGSVIFDWTIKQNHEFAINNATVANQNDIFTTNYMLSDTNLKSGKEFPYETNLNNSNLGDTISYDGKSYYTAINFVVRDILTKTQLTNLTDAYLDFVITNQDDFGFVGDEPVVSIVQDGNTYKLVLLKDITGDIEITVTAGFIHIGEYTRRWTISVQGFANFDYKYNEDAILTTSSAQAFVSGAQVKPFNTVSSDSSVYSNDGTGVIVSDIKSIRKYTYTYTVNSIQYVDLPNSQTINSAAQLFNDNSPKHNIEYTLDNSNGIITLTLPFVEQSLSTNIINHIIIMKIEMTYLNNTITRYVTYRVYNNTRVEVADAINGANINVDSDNRLRIEGGEANLALFDYSDVYTDESNNKYIVKYVYNNANKYALTIINAGEDSGTTIYSYNAEEFTYGNTTYTISEDSIVVKGDSSQNINVTKTNTIGENTLFTSTFNNVTEFANFINDIRYIQLSNMSGFTAQNDTIYYKLTYISSGNNKDKWGIDILEPYSDTELKARIDIDGKLFNGTLLADFSVVQTNSSIDIEQYSSSNNIGFRLYGNTEIIPVGTDEYRLSDLFNLNDINPNYANYRIIGIFSGDSYTNVGNAWVKLNKGTAYISSSGSAISEQVIYNKNYKLYAITFTDNSTTTSIYNAQATYYAIGVSSGNAEIMKVNYNIISASYFNVEYKANTDSTFDLTNKFLKFDMQNNALTRTEMSPSKVEYKSTSINITITVPNISISNQELIDYKANNLTATFVDLTFTATLSSGTKDFVVRFWLPNEL